ncbi:MAG: SLBB domain-containing protein [Chloroflexi bacterium]|nr:SLBB domain-containing protein [Chloroflexota bacterium]
MRPNLSTSGDPAALLRALHEAQARDERLTKETLERLASDLRVPTAELLQVASFYHYFSVGDEVPLVRGLCRGPVCSLPGLARGNDNDPPSISCPGLCDFPIAEYAAGQFSSTSGGAGGLSLPIPVDTEEALFRYIRTPGVEDLGTYRSLGGYQQLLTVVDGGTPTDVLETLRASELTGRGGAAFPIATKWRAVREATETPKYVICNADEGEPGTFKDRPLLHLNPHLLLEAMAIAGYVTGADTGIIYLRYEYPQAMAVLVKAIGEAEEAGLLGSSIAGTGFNFRLYVRRGAGSYVCGEETSLLNSLEGRVPWPRERPPFPTTHGLWGKPTVINNVETLCQVPLILEKGADWFRSLGRDGNVGTKVYSVSGKVKRPGNYELPLGVTARELILDYAGGPPGGRSVKAFVLGGISGGLLSSELLNLPLDYRAPQRHGASLGSGGIIVLDDDCCIVDFARSCMIFYEAESCGKCFPCRVGTVRLRERLDGLTGRAALTQGTRTEMQAIGDAMSNASACGMGQTAPLVVEGMLKSFSDEFQEHLERRYCRTGVCPL